jgi:hypothetical protein
MFLLLTALLRKRSRRKLMYIEIKNSAGSCDTRTTKAIRGNAKFFYRAGLLQNLALNFRIAISASVTKHPIQHAALKGMP